MRRDGPSRDGPGGLDWSEALTSFSVGAVEGGGSAVASCGCWDTAAVSPLGAERSTLGLGGAGLERVVEPRVGRVGPARRSSSLSEGTRQRAGSSSLPQAPRLSATEFGNSGAQTALPLLGWSPGERRSSVRPAALAAPPPAAEIECQECDPDCPEKRICDEQSRPGVVFSTRLPGAIETVPSQFRALFGEALNVIKTFLPVLELAAVAPELELETGKLGRPNAQDLAWSMVRHLESLLDSGVDANGVAVRVWIVTWDFNRATSVFVEDYSEWKGLGLDALFQQERMRFAEAASGARGYVQKMNGVDGGPIYVVNIPPECSSYEALGRMAEFYDGCSDSFLRSSDGDLEPKRERSVSVAVVAYLLLHELLHVAFDRELRHMTAGSQFLRRAKLSAGASLAPELEVWTPSQLLYAGDPARASEVMAYKLSNFWAYLCFGVAGPACEGSAADAFGVLGDDEAEQLWQLNLFNENYEGGNGLSNWLCTSKLSAELEYYSTTNERDYLSDLSMSWTGWVGWPV